MSYFYARAKELAAAPYGGLHTADGAAAAAAVDERRFRHAGPKPQSREAALIMLADGVEASVRSLSSRDEPAIRAMVARIIDERLSDGQFDECDLTLRDVERIREAFVAQLLGMYHQRIAYPQNKIVEIESRRAAGGGPGSVRSIYRRAVADRRHDRATASGRRSGPTTLAARDRRGARRGRRPTPASIGLILTDDRELADAQRDPPRPRRPDRRPVVPAPAAGRLPGPRGRPAAREARPSDPTAGGVRPPARAPPHLGDIVVSVERAIDQADAGRGGHTGDVRWSPADELRLLVTHGTLHVCGWDHAEPGRGGRDARPGAPPPRPSRRGTRGGRVGGAEPLADTIAAGPVRTGPGRSACSAGHAAIRGGS